MELFEDETHLYYDIWQKKLIDNSDYDGRRKSKNLSNKFMYGKGLANKKENVRPTNFQMKMELRQQAAKEKRDRRLRENEQRRKEMLEKKEAELRVKQTIQKEENEKRMREHLEQQLIEQEAQRLRIEMAVKRRHEEELRKKYKIKLFYSIA
jgi:hypothetical protein